MPVHTPRECIEIQYAREVPVPVCGCGRLSRDKGGGGGTPLVEGCYEPIRSGSVMEKECSAHQTMGPLFRDPFGRHGRRLAHLSLLL